MLTVADGSKDRLRTPKQSIKTFCERPDSRRRFQRPSVITKRVADGSNDCL
ncbi:hypothetical protein DPMN_085277 [Dreissena polymorpha]|uniref:Uncharacterized protein n=1 Tax=Dreissena polymorpha TaxID=45954 RepID=A0A9D3YDD2_DREPO|nr:hypothetical protein DPMN_085277 [Dreissena polymorpha]